MKPLVQQFICVIVKEIGMGKVIGIELGAANTKIVLGNKVKDGFELLDYRVVRNAEGVYDFDGNLDVNALAPSLEQALKEMKGLRKKCYLTISSTKSIVRNRTFPLVKKKDLDAMVQIEAEQFLPYEVTSFYIDYRVIDVNETADDKSLNVMVVAVPKYIIDDAVKLIEKAKLHLECVNVFTDAICSYHQQYLPTDDENTLIADIGHGHMRMVAFRGERYFANIISEVGVKSIEHYYLEHYGIQPDELRAYLFENKALSKESYKRITKDDTFTDFGSLNFSQHSSDAIDGFSLEKKPADTMQHFEIEYTDIIKEINKMLSFFRSRKYGSQIDRILLCGGGARAVGLMDLIEQDTEIDTYFLTHKGINENEESMLLIPTIGTIIRG